MATPVCLEGLFGFFLIVCINKFHPIICDLIKLIRKGIGIVNKLVYSLLIK